MTQAIIQFAASFAAIAAVVALAHALGFTRTGRLDSDADAMAQFRLAPGGFEPVELALDARGRGAIARDADGRIAVLAPHGVLFVVHVLPADARLIANGGELAVAHADIGSRALSLHLGQAASGWAETDGPAN